MNMQEMGCAAKEASYKLSAMTTAQKNSALVIIADSLEAAKVDIIKANDIDLELARNAKLAPAMLDRLMLNEKRLDGIIADMRSVVALQDPVGTEFDSKILANGLKLLKRRVPIGVIGVIYEARPNVTVDITSLCLKTGNACILRGGRETLNTNITLVKIIQEGLKKSGLPVACVQYIENPAHEYVTELLHLDKYVDMIIPRGGERLHHICRQESTIPVIIGGFGVGHIYVDESADLLKSVAVIENSKVQRPSACNSVDTILVHNKIASTFIPLFTECMIKNGVTIIAHGEAYDIVNSIPGALCEKGAKKDFDTEWLSLRLNLRIVDSLDDVITHMRVHNACHSDAIMTNDYAKACRFVNEAGSACAYINTSTRFSDGGQFGLGAEVAISTQKLHARGPMGLTELTSYKWICSSDYLSRK